MPPIRRAALTYIVYFAAVGAAWPYLPVYYDDLGLDLGQIGLVAALSAATQLVAAPVWGGLTDRYPRTRLTLPAAALTAAAGAVILARAGGLLTVVPGAFVLSFGLAGIGPVLDARVLDLLGADKIRYGQLRAWGSLAFVVVALLVGVALDSSGMGALFLVYVPLLVATALISLSLPRGRSTAGGSVLRGAWAFVVAPGMRLFLFGSLLVWSLLAAVTGFYSIQVTALGAPPATIGLVWAFGAIVEVPIMFGFPRLAARFGTERLIVLGAAAFALRAGIAALARDPVLLVLVAPLEGAGFALSFVGGVGYVAQRARPGLAATAQGVYSATSGLASIIGAAVGGFVAGAITIAGMFAVSAGLGVIATGVVAAAVLRRPPHEALPTPSPALPSAMPAVVPAQAAPAEPVDATPSTGAPPAGVELTAIAAGAPIAVTRGAAPASDQDVGQPTPGPVVGPRPDDRNGPRDRARDGRRAPPAPISGPRRPKARTIRPCPIPPRARPTPPPPPPPIG